VQDPICPGQTKLANTSLNAGAAVDPLPAAANGGMFTPAVPASPWNGNVIVSGVAKGQPADLASTCGGGCAKCSPWKVGPLQFIADPAAIIPLPPAVCGPPQPIPPVAPAPPGVLGNCQKVNGGWNCCPVGFPDARCINDATVGCKCIIPFVALQNPFKAPPPLNTQTAAGGACPANCNVGDANPAALCGGWCGFANP
jgi:hypothetical protein